MKNYFLNLLRILAEDPAWSVETAVKLKELHDAAHSDKTPESAPKAPTTKKRG